MNFYLQQKIQILKIKNATNCLYDFYEISY